MIIHLPTCVASCLESYQLSSPVCVGQTIQDMAPTTTILLAPTNRAGAEGGRCLWVSGLWNVPPPNMHGRGMWWDFHCPCLDSPGYINLCFLPSLCLPSVYLLPTNSKSHSRVEGQAKALVWSGREIPETGAIFLLVKIERLPRDLELNP